MNSGMKVGNLWYFNFSDYKKYCNFYDLKPSDYESLLDYKRYMVWQSEEFLNGGVN